MAIEQLQIKIGAEVSGVTQALNVLQSQLARLQRLASMPNLSFDQLERLQGMMAKTGAQITKFEAVAKRTGSSLGGVKPGAEQATQSLVNLSRVAQDAPYGFIGIANNINPLLESFQRLKASTGTTGGALKALGSSLMGAGGLGLVVGVVSSLLVVFGDKLFKSGNAAKEQADKVKEAKQALDDYVDSLNDIDKARVKGLQSAQEELVHLKTLYGATQNSNIPLAERKKLVDELQEQYPKYFGNIKDEIILAGGAKTAYDSLATSILAAAKARAGQEAIVDIQKDALVVGQQLSKNAADQIKLQQQLQNINKKTPLPVAALNERKKVIEFTKTDIEVNKIIDKQNKLIAQNIDLTKKKNDLEGRSKQIADSVQRTIEATPDALTKPGANVPKTDTNKLKDDTKDIEKALEERKAILTEFQRDFEVLKLPVPELSMDLEKFSIEGLTQELSDKLNKALLSQPLKLAVPVELKPAIDVKEVPIPLHMNFQVERDMEASKKKAQDAADEEAKSLAKAIEDSFNAALSAIEIEGLSTIGESIGEALTGGDIGSVFQKFGQMLGGAVQGLGKQIIALNVAALAAKKALKLTFTNPALGIAAGVALVAVGTALKNLLGGGIKGFNKGGRVPGGVGTRDTVPAMLTPGEEVLTTKEAPIWRTLKKLFINTSFKMPKIDSGVFHFNTGGTVPSIDSRSPLTKVQNSIKYNSIVDVNITGESRTRGQDLVYVWTQTQKSQRRAF